MDVAVLGLGSVLMGDDAAGPHVLRLLEATLEPGPGLRFLDLGTPGPELAHVVEGLDALIVVDTVRTKGGIPGELRFYRRDDILRGPLPERLSPHDPGLKSALAAAAFLGHAPSEVLLVGIVPKEVRLGAGLSAEVRAALPSAVAAVTEELRRLEVPCRRRAHPDLPDLFWERPTTASTTPAAG